MNASLLTSQRNNDYLQEIAKIEKNSKDEKNF